MMEARGEIRDEEREGSDKVRKRKWDTIDERKDDLKSTEGAINDPLRNAEEKISSKRLSEALKKAREHAAQINLCIPSLQQGSQKHDLDGKGQGSAAAKLSVGLVDGGTPIKRKVTLGREEFFKNIEINDVKNRYIITKGATQIRIKQETGSDITTRGKFYPDKSMATDKDPPLYLHVSAPTREALDKAVEMIEEMINQPPITIDSSKRSSPSQNEKDKYPISDNITVDIEPDRSFNVRAKILGPGGAYVKHIQQETGTKVQLKGRGSGYLELGSDNEAQVPLYISIGGSSQESVDSAKALCEDLLDNVRNEYNRLKQQRMARIQQPIMQPAGYMDVHMPINPLSIGRQGAYQGYMQPPYSPVPPHVVPGAPMQQAYQLGSTITDTAVIQAQYNQYYQYGYGALPPQTPPTPYAQQPPANPPPEPPANPPPEPPPEPPENDKTEV